MADGLQNPPERILGITRTQNLAELDDSNSKLHRTLAAMEASGIVDCYVVLDTGSVDSADTAGEPEVRRIGEVDVTIVHDSNPTSPTAMNAALDVLERADARSKPAFTHFLAVSKEVISLPRTLRNYGLLIVALRACW